MIQNISFKTVDYLGQERIKPITLILSFVTFRHSPTPMAVNKVKLTNLKVAMSLKGRL